MRFRLIASLLPPATIAYTVRITVISRMTPSNMFNIFFIIGNKVFISANYFL